MVRSNIYTLSLVCLLVGFFILSCSNSNDSILNSLDTDDGIGLSNDGSSGEITLYRVNGDVIEKVRDFKVSGVNAAYQKDVIKHQELWETIKKVVPPSYRNYMGEFLIFNGEESGTAGFVFELNDELSKWQMGIDITLADDEQELLYTVIHEFGHILTLNITQVDGKTDESNCPRFFTGEGCARDASYINNLHENYWLDIWNEFLNIGDSSSEHEAFYNKYSNRFVTNYASTNPGEDIAEVFTIFVTRNSKPSGSTVAEQKILQMYNQEELMDLRDYIRNGTTQAKGLAHVLPEPGSWKRATTIGDHHSHHIHSH